MSKSKKIVIATGIYPPDIGGPATYVPLLAQRLIDYGYTVHVVTLRDKKIAVQNSGAWQCTAISRQLPKAIRIPCTVFTLLKAAKDSSVIFANGIYEEVAIASLFKPRMRIIMKIVGDPIWERFKNKTGSLVGIKTFNENNPSVICGIQRYVLRLSLNRSKLVFTPSKQLADLVLNWKVKAPVRVINNGIQCRELEPNVLKYDVVSVSRLVTWKNIDKIINACAKNNLSLAICGDGPERSRLELLSAHLNSKVIFFGTLSPSEVRDVINASKVYALLSDYEGLSFSLLEAMMAGKEILVSAIPGNTSVISNGINGCVINVEDEEGIANTLNLLVNDSSNKLGANAYEDVRANFCAEKQLDLAIETMELKK